MSKKILYLLGILLTIIVGTIFHWFYCCNYDARAGSQENAAANIPVVTIPDEETTEPQTATSDSDESKKWEAAREKLNSDPLNFYCETNMADFNPGQLDSRKFVELQDYLNNNPEATINITGHTDITGSRNYNLKLGQARADKVKAYMQKNGISENRIITESSGPDEPIADNNTPEGRAKNRRVVILIK